jgi:hypothetical protein
VLGHRHQADVGEPQSGDVVRKLLGQFAVGQRPAAVLGATQPGPEMHLVGRHRGVEPVGRVPPLEPGVVGPLVRGDGIGLEGEVALAGEDLVLVAGPRPDAGTNSSQIPDEPSERMG